MSKFTVSRQIQQLKAANAGQIALGDSGVHHIGVAMLAVVSQLVSFAVAVIAASSLVTPTMPTGQNLAIGASQYDEVVQQGTKSISFSIAESVVTVTAMPSESPTIGVAIFTNVT